MKLSIAMSTYDGATYLPEQLESIAAQTRLPDELVVCDDGSNDGRTREIIKAFAKKAQFPVRLFVNRKNLGSKRSFEKAIRLCRGDIIFLCDQDDVWNEKKLARIAETFLAAPEVGLVFTDAEVVDEDLEIMANSLWECVGFTFERQDLIKQGKAFKALLGDNVVTGATMAFRSGLRRLVLPIPAETILQHDGWIALIIAAVARVEFLDEPLIKYRQHAKQQIGISITGSKYEQRESSLISSILKCPYPQGKMDALKTAYARLLTKCSSLISTENLNDIQDWIIRLENEKAVLENDKVPVEMKKDWMELKEDLESRTIEFEPYIWAELSRYHLRPRELQRAVAAILSERLASHQLTSLSQQLETRIKSLSADLAAAQEKTATLERRLAEQGEKSDQLLAAERDLVEKEQELRSLRALLLDKEQSIGSLSGRLVEQNRLLQELTVEDEESQQLIGRLAGQLAEKERQLAGKQRQLVEREWQLTGKQQQLVSLRKEKEQIVASLSAQLAEKEQALERTKAQLAATETRLDEITSSRGWRLLTRYRSLKSGQFSRPNQTVSTDSEQLSGANQEVSTDYYSSALSRF